MEFAVAGIIFFLVLLLIALHFGTSKERQGVAIEEDSLLHGSGVYSIVRKSPRTAIIKIKPSSKEICQYLTEQNEKYSNTILTDTEKEVLLKNWNEMLEQSIHEIETGDKRQIEFYYYDFFGEDDICRTYIRKGYFVTRRDIHKYPELVPPFHLGCRCILKGYTQDSPSKIDTATSKMKPFISDTSPPQLPQWKQIFL